MAQEPREQSRLDAVIALAQHRGFVFPSGDIERDLASIGRPVQAMIAVRIRPPSRRNIEAFRNWAEALPDVLGVFVSSGTEDFLLHLAVADNDDPLRLRDRPPRRAPRGRRRAHLARRRTPAQHPHHPPL